MDPAGPQRPVVTKKHFNASKGGDTTELVARLNVELPFLEHHCSGRHRDYGGTVGADVLDAPGLRPLAEMPAGASVAAAMCRLIGADQMALYMVDHRTGQAEPAPAWTPPGSLAADDCALLLESSDLLRVSPAGGTWLPEKAADGRATLAVVLGRRRGRTALLVSHFSRMTAGARARASRLIPDLVTLIGHHASVHERLRRLEEENAAASAALDHGECGIVAVAADGTPVFCNTAAERFLAAGDGLQLRRGEVRPTGYAEAIRFRAALDEVADAPGAGAAAGAERDRPRAMAMLLPRRDGGRPTILAIAPARGRARATTRASAILYILEAGQQAPARMDAVCRLHGLSRVETSLIRHLVGGLTLSEAAGEMHVKPETARAYLKQVFAKTGTHRQVDLVALISRYGRAMRGDFDFQPA